MTEQNTDGHISVTATIERYRAGELTWNELVAFVTSYPFTVPDLPDSMDWIEWDTPPDTFQTGTWGEVTAAEVDGLLTLDEYITLTDAYDAACDARDQAAGRSAP